VIFQRSPRKIREYVHNLNEEVQSISGRYELVEEGMAEVFGERILYVVGNAIVDSSCCGVGGCRYAIVPGYVRAYKSRKNDRGLWISDVEPIINGKTRQEIIRFLEEKELVSQVQFL